MIQDYIQILKDEKCSVCDRDKKIGFAFCYKCYSSLPNDIQRELYRKMGEGFEEAVDEAVKYLTD